MSVIQIRPSQVVTEAESQRRSGQAPVLLDVREAWEVALASVSHPALTPLFLPKQTVPTELARMEAAQPVFVLCHHGMRSLQVASFLLARGFTQVYNIDGGIDAWSSEVDPKVARY